MSNDNKKCMIFRCHTGCNNVVCVVAMRPDVLIDFMDKMKIFLGLGVLPEIVTVAEFKSMPWMCECREREIQEIVERGKLPKFWDVSLRMRGNVDMEINEKGALGISAEDAARRCIANNTGKRNIYRCDDDRYFLIFEGGGAYHESEAWAYIYAENWEEIATPVSYSRRLELAGMPALPLGVS